MSTGTPPANLLERLVSLGKQRGFFFPSSEIYGGINALYDYGPLGTRLRRNIRNRWWRSIVELRDDIEGIESSVIMNPQVWVASGHVAGFSDPLVDCTGSCRKRWRADHLPAEGFDHPDQVLAGEHRVIHDQIAHRLSVLAPLYGRKLFHGTPPKLQLNHDLRTFGR